MFSPDRRPISIRRDEFFHQKSPDRKRRRAASFQKLLFPSVYDSGWVVFKP
jgi:hypothetical protein